MGRFLSATRRLPPPAGAARWECLAASAATAAPFAAVDRAGATGATPGAMMPGAALTDRSAGAGARGAASAGAHEATADAVAACAFSLVLLTGSDQRVATPARVVDALGGRRVAAVRCTWVELVEAQAGEGALATVLAVRVVRLASKYGRPVVGRTVVFVPSSWVLETILSLLACVWPLGSCSTTFSSHSCSLPTGRLCACYFFCRRSGSSCERHAASLPLRSVLGTLYSYVHCGETGRTLRVRPDRALRPPLLDAAQLRPAGSASCRAARPTPRPPPRHHSAPSAGDAGPKEHRARRYAGDHPH